jgi:hypothetical protein
LVVVRAAEPTLYIATRPIPLCSHVVDVAPQQRRRDIDLRLRAAQLIGALPM